MLIAKINMPMPDTCHECPFAKWYYDRCKCILLNKSYYDTNKLAYERYRECSLKEGD